MARAAFITLLPVGTPWSERREGETFAEWANNVFESQPHVAGEELQVTVQNSSSSSPLAFPRGLGPVLCSSRCLPCCQPFVERRWANLSDKCESPFATSPPQGVGTGRWSSGMAGWRFGFASPSPIR